MNKITDTGVLLIFGGSFVCMWYLFFTMVMGRDPDALWLLGIPVLGITIAVIGLVLGYAP